MASSLEGSTCEGSVGSASGGSGGSFNGARRASFNGEGSAGSFDCAGGGVADAGTGEGKGEAGSTTKA